MTPEADELWEKLCSCNPCTKPRIAGQTLILVTAACRLSGNGSQNRPASCSTCSGSRLVGASFRLMLFAGLFVQTGDRYQMTIPDVIDIRKVHDRLADWLKRMDQENLNPNDLFVTLTERDAKSWEARLRHMDVAARVADRATLLGAPW